MRYLRLHRETLIAGLILLGVATVAALWLMPGDLRPAPPLVGETLDGRTLTLQQLRGKPVLVTFWATSCPGCIEEIPHLTALYQEFQPKGLEIIGVAMAYDSAEQVQNLVRQRQIPYPVILDRQGHLAREFDNVRLTPTSILISPEGRIVEYRLGLLDLPKLRQTLERWL